MTPQITQKVLRFFRSEDGPTAVEYALMLFLIVLAAITAIENLGQSSSETFGGLAEDMPGK
jgi:pilus assembly protein Flp/PilA